MQDDKKIKQIVKNKYAEMAVKDSGCGCSCSCGSKNNQDISKSIGYSEEDLQLAKGANLGLGCGNP
ncbi:MAG: arsenite S-adenosylmethyltransferase, partial [Patescibacteria group bacterium]|nr:arsenite S-adenosylmethyltransferase [Patescibacteria group bacterium]